MIIFKKMFAEKILRFHVSQEHHAADDDNSGEYGRGSHTYQLSEREIQSYGEQEENNTDIRPYLDIGLVGNSRE